MVVVVFLPPEMDGVVVAPDCPEGVVFVVDCLVVVATPKMVAVTA